MASSTVMLGNVMEPFGVTYEGGFTADVSGAEREAHLDAVMAELVTLGAADPAIALSGRVVEISVAVEAAGPEDAIARGAALIRTALHAAGGSTADWPMPRPEWSLDGRGSSSRRTNLIDV